ncbi:MAG: PduL/EutD family phosphate acyltransferase [Patescibacteria group bacterium]|jgi:propanediol utilization protein
MDKNKIMTAKGGSTYGGKAIIEVSGHHCHISRKDLDVIYGKNYQLTPLKTLSQNKQFAAKETVTVAVGDKKIEDVRILGPERKNTQVEVSLTEAYHLKIKPPVAECTCPDKIDGCVIAEISGPKGKIKRCSIIIAYRHFHTDPKTAQKIGLKNGQLISLKTTGQRSVTFHNILVRVNENFKPRVHLDTDEANAAGLKDGQTGEIII